jgi:hypothetical protein
MIRGVAAGTVLLCWRHIRAPVATASVQAASGTKRTKIQNGTNCRQLTRRIKPVKMESWLTENCFP